MGIDTDCPESSRDCKFVKDINTAYAQGVSKFESTSSKVFASVKRHLAGHDIMHLKMYPNELWSLLVFRLVAQIL